MALPDDQEGRLRCYRNALRNWRVRGYVNFRPRVADELAELLPDLPLPQIARELHRYVEAGGEVKEVVERRALECADDAAQPFHHDLRIQIGGRRIYFETVLVCDDPDDPDDPTIDVVSIQHA